MNSKLIKGVLIICVLVSMGVIAFQDHTNTNSPNLTPQKSRSTASSTPTIKKEPVHYTLDERIAQKESELKAYTTKINAVDKKITKQKREYKKITFISTTLQKLHALLEEKIQSLNETIHLATKSLKEPKSKS